MFTLASTGDSILIGTNRGIVRKDIRFTKPLIAVNRILSQRVHQEAELVTGIELEYPQNTLSVEVTALSSRTFPEEFQYSFLLFDSNNEIVKKRFTYKEEFLMDNLAPGSYRAEIRAFDRNLASSDPLTFSVKVARAPFPWIATILAVLLFIALAALGWATLSQRKIFRTSRQLAIANKELNNARLNLANEAERERHRIAGDLHDQTLADLRHLLLMADDVPTEKAAEFRTEIENVSDEIRRICEDLSPSVLENIGFTAALEWELGNAVEQISDTKTIETSFDAEENLDDSLNLSRAEQIQIYRIAQEVLNNIVRHAKPDKIWMKVVKSRKRVLRLEIRDNGRGFDPAEITNKKGRGVTNIKARAQLIKAEIRWKRLTRRGTEFTLVI
jgi:signal transduction histidine kinase